MLRDVYWRQYPIDLLSDDKMACVEAELPEELRFAPYMFYCAALKLCDDNGVFDLDDGVIIARLMRIKDVNIVFQIANLMRKRKILYRLFDDSMLCGLVDWTYSDKKSRSIEERRKIVAEAIQKERSSRTTSMQDFTSAPETAPKAFQPAPQTQPQEAETAPQAADFLCPENEKKAENVVKSEMDDKNAKNVVTLQDNTVQDNKTVQTDIQDIHTNTHTQQQPTGYGPVLSPPPVGCQNTDAVGVKNIQDQNTETANTPTDEGASAGEDISSLAEQALREAQEDVENSGQASLAAYLNDFFVKNCYGFKKNQSAAALNELTGKILELSDEVNPPGTVAGLVCSEFKKMCDGQRGDYWARMPLLPANMIKPRVWAELVQHAGKILATNANSEKFIQAAKKAQEEYQTEAALVGDAMRQEYLKYNIDPENPQAPQLLLMAKSRENEEARKAKEDTADTLPPGADIF